MFFEPSIQLSVISSIKNSSRGAWSGWGRRAAEPRPRQRRLFSHPRGRASRGRAAGALRRAVGAAPWPSTQGEDVAGGGAGDSVGSGGRGAE